MTIMIQRESIRPYKVASHEIWSYDSEHRKGILKLDWNEATVSPSPQVYEALKKLVDVGDFYNLYPQTNNRELFGLLSSYLNIPKENIQYFASSDSLHEYVSKCFIEAGSLVTIIWPSYDNFRLTAELAGANIDYYHYKDNFIFDEDDFIAHLRIIKPTLVYLCNPNNPTGNLVANIYIESLLNTFPDTMFLIDEAYSEFAGVSAKELTLRYENIIISRTMSKAFALANFRFGYAISSKKNISLLSMIRNPKNISTFSQVAVCAALKDVDYVKSYVNEVNHAKEILIEELQNCSQIKCFPGHGNFILIKVNAGEGERNRLWSILKENNIYVRLLEQDVSLRECIRITVGTQNQMKKVIGIIKKVYL